LERKKPLFVLLIIQIPKRMFSEKVVSPVLRQEPVSSVFIIIWNYWIPSGPEALWAGGRLEFIPMKIGTEMTILRLFRVFTTSS